MTIHDLEERRRNLLIQKEQVDIALFETEEAIKKEFKEAKKNETKGIYI